MTDITAFPTLTKVIEQGEEFCRRYKFGAAAKAGQAMAFQAAGTSNQVIPAVKGTTGSIVGVAAQDTASGAYGNVYKNGAVVYVVNADDTTAIDAGDVLEANDNAVGGTVSTAKGKPTTDADLIVDILGFALEDIAGGASGLAEISLQVTNRSMA